MRTSDWEFLVERLKKAEAASALLRQEVKVLKRRLRRKGRKKKNKARG